MINQRTTREPQRVATMRFLFTKSEEKTGHNAAVQPIRLLGFYDRNTDSGGHGVTCLDLRLTN